MPAGVAVGYSGPGGIGDDLALSGGKERVSIRGERGRPVLVGQKRQAVGFVVGVGRDHAVEQGKAVAVAETPGCADVST